MVWPPEIFTIRESQWLIGLPRRSQVGTLHKSLIRAEAAALSPQCREASGLSAESLARAEPLDKVLQQSWGWRQMPQRMTLGSGK